METGDLMKPLQPVFAFFSNSWVTFACGIFLVIASASELRETLFTFSEGLRGHHAIFVYGLVMVMRSLAEMQEGMEDIQKDRDKPRRSSRLA